MTAPAELAGAVRELLADVVVVADLTESAGFVRDNPDFRCVTADGDLIGAHWAHGGSAGAQSLLDVRAAADDAAAKLAAAEMASEAAAETLAEATEATDEARQVLEEIRGRLRAADAATAEISGRLGRLAGAARAAADEAKRLDAAVGAAQRSAEKDLAKLAQLKTELAEAEADEDRARDPEVENEQADEERAELTRRAAAAREAEMEARLEVRTVEERLRAISGRADSLAASATAERAARERAAIRRRQRAAQARGRPRRRRRGGHGRVRRRVVAGRVQRAPRRRRDRDGGDQRDPQDRPRPGHGGLGRARRGGEHRPRDRDLQERAPAPPRAAGVARDRRVRRRARRPGRRVRPRRPDPRPGDLRPSPSPPASAAPPSPSPKPRRLTAPPRPRLPPHLRAPSHDFGPGLPHLRLRPVRDSDPRPVRPRSRPIRTFRHNRYVGHLDGAAAPVAPPRVARGRPPRGADRGGRGRGADPAAQVPRRRGRAEQPETVGVPYVRAEQEERAAEADRQLTRLGKVNPLALEEYEALQERHQFLATQLEDLRKTRRDLLTVVKEVDDRVQEVFASAYADTAREFEGLFSRLFPGGSGRLMLTEPDDMLTTGIEIEARPPGKKVKRLSLLSGGERSLTAIAYLFAIFKARPSPFYVLDEVEAALDDSNLQRLLGVFGELQESSQLIVITHQRRTMEAADALYGVSMRGDGVSTVISQRVRESEPA